MCLCNFRLKNILCLFHLLNQFIFIRRISCKLFDWKITNVWYNNLSNITVVYLPLLFIWFRTMEQNAINYNLTEMLFTIYYCIRKIELFFCKYMHKMFESSVFGFIFIRKDILFQFKTDVLVRPRISEEIENSLKQLVFKLSFSIQ